MKQLFDHFQPTKTEKILLTAVLLLSVTLIFFKCKQQLTNTVVQKAVPNAQITVKEKLNDSTVFLKQEALLAETQEQVHILNDKLQEAMSHMMEISKVTTSIQYHDSIQYIKVPGERVRDTIVKIQLANTTTYPMHFRHRSKFLEEAYTVVNKDSSNIDYLKIIGKGHIVVGETGKWYQKKTLVVGLMNENPYYIMDSVRSVVYRSKEVLQISVGPSIMINAHSSSLGVGITAKKGIFSCTLGYKLF